MRGSTTTLPRAAASSRSLAFRRRKEEPSFSFPRFRYREVPALFTDAESMNNGSGPQPVFSDPGVEESTDDFLDVRSAESFQCSPERGIHDRSSRWISAHQGSDEQWQYAYCPSFPLCAGIHRLESWFGRPIEQAIPCALAISRLVRTPMRNAGGALPSSRQCLGAGVERVARLAFRTPRKENGAPPP